jgi:hypothetical protein
MSTTPRVPTDRARSFATLLDSVFRVPGTRFRFGLDPLLGLLPGVGDAIGGGFGVYLLVLAFRLGAPPIVLFRMFVRFLADLLFGSIPLLGDLFDAAFKANLRNLDLLERYLSQPQETTRESLLVVILLSAALLAAVVGAVWLAIAAIQGLIGALT